MKPVNNTDPEMLDEYDFRRGRRGRYAARYAQGTNIILLDPDVAAHFTGSAQVNAALREFLKISGKTDKSVMPKQPGPDSRYRTNDAKIQHRRSDALIGTIRKKYPGFAPGTRSDSSLGTYLEKNGFDSLSDALKNRKKHK
jgi:hypothetical protein